MDDAPGTPNCANPGYFHGKDKPFLFLLISTVLLLTALAFPPDAGAAENDKTMRMAFLPNISQMEIVKTFGPFVKALENEIGMRIEVFSGKDYTEIIENFRNKTVDIGMLGAFAYVSAHDDFGVKIFARNREAKKNGEASQAYHSLIITRKDSGITSLDGVKGKRFSFTDPKSTSGFLFPLVGLMNHSIMLKDIGTVIYVNKHPNSLLAVYHGQVDAGALAEDHFSSATGVNLDEMVVLWKSEPIHYGAWVARNDMPDEQVAHIQSAFLAISRRADAADIFKQSYIKGFIAAEDANYENVRQLIRVQAVLDNQ
ncbi:MAG: phosphate/phosphite/phosphonate ABC transporter substrate-binding protein [Desulfamplus sp.]|nr:phosphate/phosphite/phosphonate ABC transporter substrate-binding protein [Desulfamplus sp.]